MTGSRTLRLLAVALAARPCSSRLLAVHCLAWMKQPEAQGHPWRTITYAAPADFQLTEPLQRLKRLLNGTEPSNVFRAGAVGNGLGPNLGRRPAQNRPKVKSGY